MGELVLPNDWVPRPYQRKAWDYLENGGKRANIVWHRRAGKDDLCLHWTATAAMQRVGTYWHMLPQAEQARKAIWRAVDPHKGKRRIDIAFPEGMRAKTRDQEMNIEFANGSLWQVVGSDNFNSLMGSPPIGVVFSEWPLSNPLAWSYISPILEENQGWAIFNGTPRGTNHGKTLYEFAKDSPHWFCERLTAHDTGIFTGEQLNRILGDLVGVHGGDQAQSIYEQEYFCSFEAARFGAYYASAIRTMRESKRYGIVPADPLMTYRAFWDVGGTGAKADHTVIWIAQFIGKQICVLDYYEAQGQPLATHVNWLRKRGYENALMILPHDGAHHEKVYQISYETALRDAGFEVPTPVPNMGAGAAMNRIEAARRLFPRIWINEETCKAGVDALNAYHAKFDEERRIDLGPDHDWASHAADAFGMMCVVYEEPAVKKSDKWKPSHNRSWMSI